MGVLSTFKATGWITGLLMVPLSLQAQAKLSQDESKSFEREGKNIVDILQNYHYGRVTFAALENSAILKKYLGEIDRDRRILTASDVATLTKRFERTLKSVYLLRGDYSPAFEINDRFKKRLDERIEWIKAYIARHPEEEGTDATFSNLSKKNTPLEAAELDVWWAHEVTDRMVAAQVSGFTVEEAEKKVLDDFLKWQEDVNHRKAVAIRELFIDSMARTFDPHSGYFSADSAEDFSRGMEGGLSTVGLSIIKKNGKCVVNGIFEGSAADEVVEITIDDEVLEIEEAGKPTLNAKTAFLRTIWERLMGPEDSAVKIKFQRPGEAQPFTIELKRHYFLLEPEKAQGAVIQRKNVDGSLHKYGYLRWPQFYHSENALHPASVAADVEELLKKQQGEGIEGLVIDLRGNPGGALPEALSLVGLFVGKKTGSVTGSADGAATPLFADRDVLYNGPIAILTSEQSASASELFSKALQYYRRAIVIGGESTFGKGSVQNYLDLGRFQGEASKQSATWGTLRVTFEVFAAPDGRSIQKTGTLSDVVLPLQPLPDFENEREMEDALPAKDLTISAPKVDDTWLSESTLKAVGDAARSRFGTEKRWKLSLEREAILSQFSARSPRALSLSKRQEAFSQLRERYQKNDEEREALAKEFDAQFRQLALKSVEDQRHLRDVTISKLFGGEKLQGGVLHHGTFRLLSDDGHVSSIRTHEIDWLLVAENQQYARDLTNKAGKEIPSKALKTAVLRHAADKEYNLSNLQKEIRGQLAKETFTDQEIQDLTLFFIKRIVEDQRVGKPVLPIESPSLQESLTILDEIKAHQTTSAGEKSATPL